MGSMQAALPQVGDPLAGLASQWGQSFQPTATPGNFSLIIALPGFLLVLLVLMILFSFPFFLTVRSHITKIFSWHSYCSFTLGWI